MNIRRNSEATAHKNTEACVAYEYPMPTDALNAAVIELSGRYPDEGWIANSAVTSLVHVVHGNGTITNKQGVTDLAAGDQVLIAPEEKYFFDGSMKLLYVATPAWTPEQAKYTS